MSIKRWYGIEDLEKRLGPMSVRLFLRSFREAEGLSQTQYAKKLGISRANLCDIEKGRKQITAERAAKLARRMEVPEMVLIQLALQDGLRAAKLDYRVEVRAA